MKVAEQGLYLTKNSAYVLIKKSSGSHALFKNNEELIDPEVVFDNLTIPILFYLNDKNELENGPTGIKTTKVDKFYSMESKSEFIAGLETIGEKISSKIDSSDKITKDLFVLRENKDVDFSLIRPIGEIRENSGVYIYDKKSYGIAGCYIKLAKDMGYEKMLLDNDKFKKILRNMAINTNGIAKEVVEEYKNSINNNPKMIK